MLILLFSLNSKSCYFESEMQSEPRHLKCDVNGQNCNDLGLICCVDNVRSQFAKDGQPKNYGCMSENMCQTETISSKFFIWPFFREG